MTGTTQTLRKPEKRIRENTNTTRSETAVQSKPDKALRAVVAASILGGVLGSGRIVDQDRAISMSLEYADKLLEKV